MINILPTTLNLEIGKELLNTYEYYPKNVENEVLSEFMFKLQEDINFVKESNKITEESLEIK